MGLLGTNLVRLNAPALKQSVGWFWQQLPKLAKAPVIEKIGEDVLFLSGRLIKSEGKEAFQTLNQAQKLLATAQFMWRKLTLPFHSALFKQYGDAVRTLAHVSEYGGQRFTYAMNLINPLYDVSLVPLVAAKNLKDNAKLFKDSAGSVIQEVSGRAAKHTGKFWVRTEKILSQLVSKNEETKALKEYGQLYRYGGLGNSVRKHLKDLGHRLNFFVVDIKNRPKVATEDWEQYKPIMTKAMDMIK
jgi:hypothetical protein